MKLNSGIGYVTIVQLSTINRTGSCLMKIQPRPQMVDNCNPLSPVKRFSELGNWILYSIFIVEPNQDGSFFRNGYHKVPTWTVLDSIDRTCFGFPDCTQTSLFVFPNLKKICQIHFAFWGLF